MVQDRLVRKELGDTIKVPKKAIDPKIGIFFRLPFELRRNEYGHEKGYAKAH